MKMLINQARSIIPACDVDSIQMFERIIKETASFPEVSAYKIGATLGLTFGLPNISNIAKKYTFKPLIYDHQKAGTDIPDTGKSFMKMLKKSGFDYVIIFPLSGPATQKAWIEAALDQDLILICGGHMTHKNFVYSEGGYIADEAIEKMYVNAADQGIKDFVVPGNKPDIISNIRIILESKKIQPVFYSPGFISQGGSISEATKAAGSHWHAIVGRAIYESSDIVGTIKELSSKL
jgi:orotidine-5'-phosphate decarboxylase